MKPWMLAPLVLVVACAANPNAPSPVPANQPALATQQPTAPTQPAADPFSGFISGRPNIWKPNTQLVFYASSLRPRGPVSYTWTVVGEVPYTQQPTAGRDDILSIVFSGVGWVTIQLSATDGFTTTTDQVTGYVHFCVVGEACL